MTTLNPNLMLPPDVAGLLADRVRTLRLQREWKRSTLAERAGVSMASLKRFETTGKVSLASLLRLAHALGRLAEFADLLRPPPARSIDELEAGNAGGLRRRGRR